MTNTLIPTNMPIRKPVYVGAGTNQTTVHGEKYVPFAYDSMSGKMWMAGRELPTNVTVIYFEAGVHHFTQYQEPPREFMERYMRLEDRVATKLDLTSVLLVSGLMALVVVWASFCARTWMRGNAQKWNSAIDDVEEAK